MVAHASLANPSVLAAAGCIFCDVITALVEQFHFLMEYLDRDGFVNSLEYRSGERSRS
jgi:hypothetical protein